MTSFLKYFQTVRRFLFDDDASKLWIRFRFWLALKLLPKDFSNFFEIVISKLDSQYENLEPEKRDKITSLVIDFEFRE